MRHIFIFNLAGLAALICLSISPGVVNRQFEVKGTLLSRKTGEAVEDVWVQITGERGEVLYWDMLTTREAKIKTNRKGCFRISVFTQDPTTFQLNATTDLPKKEYSVSKKDGGNFWQTYPCETNTPHKTSVGKVYMEDKTWKALVKKVEKKIDEFKEVYYDEVDRRTPR